MELEILKQDEDGAARLILKGRITTNSAPYLERMVGSVITNYKHLILDCTQLEYTSSAGIRVFKKIYLWTKAHNTEFELYNVNDSVMEVLQMVGLANALTIK